MAPFLPTRQRGSYGADLDGPRLVLVRADRARQGLRFATLAPAAATELARDIERGRAVLAGVLPAQESFTRWLTTPLTAPAKARKVLPALLDVQLPFPLENCLYQFPALGPDADRRLRALAVAAQRSDVTARLELYRARGLDPVVLDHEGLALWTQGLAEAPPEPGALRVVAYVGLSRTALAAGRGTDLLNAHGVRLGAEALATPEALRQWTARVNQILRALLGEAAGAATLQWLWAGPGAAEPGLRARLQPVIEPAERMVFHALPEPGAFLARALAARAAQPGPLRCNLRCADLVHPAERRWRAQGRRRAAAGALLGGLLLCGLNLGWQGLLARRADRLQTDLAALARDLAQTARVPPGQEVLTVQRARKAQIERLQPMLAVFRPSLTSDLAALLAVARQYRLTLDSLVFDGRSFLLHGATDDWNRCDPAAARLRALGYSVDLARKEAGADEVIRFTLKGTRAHD